MSRGEGKQEFPYFGECYSKFHTPSFFFFFSFNETANQIMFYSDFCIKMPCVGIHDA